MGTILFIMTYLLAAIMTLWTFKASLEHKSWHTTLGFIFFGTIFTILGVWTHFNLDVLLN